MIDRLDPQRRGLGGKADSDHVRRQNRSLVLSALRRREPIARVDLGQETHLSPATITAITFCSLQREMLFHRACSYR